MSQQPPEKPHARWRRDVLQFLAEQPDRNLKTRAVARALDVSEDDYPEFRLLIKQMLREGKLTLGPGRRLLLPEKTHEIVGEFHGNDRGFGFISVAGREDDLFVPRSHTGGARDGDTVAARLGRPSRRTGQPRAEIVEIIQRAPLQSVGTLERVSGEWVVRAKGKKGWPLIRIDDPSAKDARPGDLVVVEPLEHTLDSQRPRGVILERLGDASAARSIVLAMIRQHGIPDEFPSEVRKQAQQAVADFEENLPADRKDLRKLLTFTIDPRDARDFDDAITLENLKGGHTRLGVHIADVAHFVPEGSPLDLEARQRGNSAYFPKHVVPMLPEVLSNGVCSLQPNVPRLAKSVFITYDAKARVVETSFANSVIESDIRLTYEQVTDALAGADDDLPDKVVRQLKDAEALAKRIRKRRLADGMLVLNLPEVELELDETGNVIDAGPADTSFSHTIIEMFMVEANEAVCRHLADLEIPMIRRIHPEPDPDGSRALQELRPLLGRELPDELDRDTIQMLLRSVQGKPEEQAVSFILLRSMPQAEYSAGQDGHFALASTHYSHFTSPIRRYPDLIVHRQLDRWLRGEFKKNGKPGEVGYTHETLTDIATESSRTERRAQTAERDAQKAILLEFMADKIGDSFDAIITGVMSFGVFVQLQPYLAEGLIKVGDFDADRWEYDERSSSFYGHGSGRQIFIGQRLRVIVASVDRVRQEMNLVPDHGVQLGVPRRKTSKKPAKPKGGRKIKRRKRGEKKAGAARRGKSGSSRKGRSRRR